jgi:hypothetical protein
MIWKMKNERTQAGRTGGNRAGLVRGNDMLWRQTPANLAEEAEKA